MSNSVLSHTIKWFAASTFVLNLDKTNIIKFITKNSSHSQSHTSYKQKYVGWKVNIKFVVYLYLYIFLFFIYNSTNKSTTIINTVYELLGSYMVQHQICHHKGACSVTLLKCIKIKQNLLVYKFITI